ncbi:MAG: histidine phosphatase family protein [Alphaproteobacteria bacterium]|nr:histidine phosphatase family protein [Alphaproteobacteria bacterium]
MAQETRLFLLRHAPVIGPAGVIHASDASADLSDRKRLTELRARLPESAICYASPSRRTMATAGALGLDPIAVAEFREQNFGDWTGQRHDDLAASGGAAYARFWSDPAHSRPPGGESFADQVARVAPALKAISDAGAILVVHSGTIRAILSIALDLAPQNALRFVIDPLSLTRIDRIGHTWRIGAVNQSL